jgi:hypothetical protein
MIAVLRDRLDAAFAARRGGAFVDHAPICA